MRVPIFLLFCLASIHLCAQAAGTLDATYAATGIVNTPFGASSSEAFAVAIQPDGKIVCGGNYTTGGNARIAFVRYNANGTLDNTFGTGGKVQISTTTAAIVRAIHLYTDGKILGAGTMNNKPVLVKILANGTPDNSFGTSGIVTFDGGLSGITDIKVDGQGRIYGCGKLTNSPTSLIVFRLKTDGTFDTTYGTMGLASLPSGGNLATPTRIAFQFDKVVVCGYYANTSNAQKSIVGRFTNTGAVDNTFATNGRFISSFGNTNELTDNLVINSDAKITLCGRQQVGSAAQIMVYKLSANGALETSFGTNGKINHAIGSTGEECPALIVQGDGKIVIGGSSSVGTSKHAYIMRLSKTGEKDATFGNGGQTVIAANGFGTISGLAIQGDRKLVGAGLSPNGNVSSFTSYRFHAGTYTSTQEPSILEESKVYPNPAIDVLHYSIQLTASDQISVQLVSVDGKVIASLGQNQSVSAGRNQLKFHLDGWIPTGTYLLQVQGRRFRDVQTIIKQ